MRKIFPIIIVILGVHDLPRIAITFLTFGMYVVLTMVGGGITRAGWNMVTGSSDLSAMSQATRLDRPPQ